MPRLAQRPVHDTGHRRPSPPDTPPKVITIGACSYEVVWDGSHGTLAHILNPDPVRQETRRQSWRAQR